MRAGFLNQSLYSIEMVRYGDAVAQARQASVYAGYLLDADVLLGGREARWDLEFLGACQIYYPYLNRFCLLPKKIL